MITRGINYNEIVDEVMHLIVYKVLKQVELNGLPGNHHFFISFLTSDKDVRLSKSLRDKYPHEMTIVLQYQFYNLSIDPNGFSVTLNFSGVPEEIYIPFRSMVTFVDPSVQFGLQFNSAVEEEQDIEDLVMSFLEGDELYKEGKRHTSHYSYSAQNSKSFVDTQNEEQNNVILLEKFRKK